MFITKETKLKVLKEARIIVINRLYDNLTTGICGGVRSACIKYGLSTECAHQILRELHSKYTPGSDFIGWWFPTDIDGRCERVRVLNREIKELSEYVVPEEISAKESEYIYMDRPNLGIQFPPETTKPKRVKQLMLIEYDKLDHLSPITEKTIKDAIFKERNAKVTEIKVFDQD